jgi:hypothetical protein
MNKRVSFDFDHTLTRKDVQTFAKRLIDEGHEVWIVTSRFDDVEGLAHNWNWIPTQNQKLFKVAEELGIPESRIKFTNMIPKIDFLLGKGFAFHLDDDESELFDILESKDSCQPLNVGHSDWEYFCKEILNS